MTDWHPAFPLGYRDQIVVGDARTLTCEIPDESVDLIFTDPVYDRIEDYRWLAEIAIRVLRPDRSCLVWTRTSRLVDVLRVMSPPLDYAWQLIVRRFGPCQPGRTGLCTYTLCLWLRKGNARPRFPISDSLDVVWGKASLPGRSLHRWGKFTLPTWRWIEAFTEPGAIVLDPFAGSGTVPTLCRVLGRHYVAFEADPQTARAARMRVESAQIMLPGLEQLQFPEAVHYGEF